MNSRRAFFRGIAAGLPTSWLAFQSSLKAAPSAGTEDYWLMVKRQFPLADGLVYLNAANVCPTSRPVFDRHLEFLRDFHMNPSFQNREKYDPRKESLRSKLAAVLSAEADEIAIVRNTSEGANTVVNGIDLKEGDEILITTHNHPSSNESWKMRAKRDRLVVREAKVPIPATSSQQLFDSIEREITSKTRVLVVTHVTSTTGNRYPVVELAKLARKHNLWYHVDGAQTFGALNVNLRTIDCDSFAGSAHKWAMGPLEAGVLYVRKERLPQIWPSIVTAGWAENLRGARKLEVYGQRDDPRLVAFEASVEFLQLLGMQNVEMRLERLVTHLKRRLAENPAVLLKTSQDWAISGGVVKFMLKGKNTRQAYDALYNKHRLAIAQTGGGESEGLRLSPHVYNSIEEIDQAVDAVKQIA